MKQVDKNFMNFPFFYDSTLEYEFLYNRP